MTPDNTDKAKELKLIIDGNEIDLITLAKRYELNKSDIVSFDIQFLLKLYSMKYKTNPENKER